jgi:hypothetical protein
MRRLLRIESVSVLVALGSLIAALVFSTVQARLTKEATELQLLTQLHALVTESQATVDLAQVQKSIDDGSYAGGLDYKQNQQLTRAASNMDYLAWLFEEDFIDLPRAGKLWQPAMRCFYEAGRHFWGVEKMRASYGSLTRAARGGEPCLNDPAFMPAAG